MKIAFIGQKGLPARFGGIERHVEELAVRLVKAGHAVTVYARPWYTPSTVKNYRGVTVTTLSSLHTKNFDAISHTFLATIRAIRGNFDVIHYHGVGPALLAFIPRLVSPKVKVVVTFHCIDRKHQKWGFFARAMLKMGEWAACRFAHQTIAVSQTIQHYCANVYDRDTVYIPNGVERQSAAADSDLIAERFGLKKNGYIACVARLVRHKGIHYAIAAYQQLATTKKLVIVGGSAFTDDYVDELKVLANDNPKIIFTGYQQGEMLDQLFANAAFIVHPSESEGLPLTVLEAMSYGKTVLASDIPENMEILRGFGFSFRNKSISDLKRKLSFLLARPTLLKTTGQQAKHYVLANYHWDDIAAKTSQLYERLTSPVKAKLAVSRA